MKQEREPVKVSVVIPVYNVAKYLEACLDSVVGQTLQEIEIICVNDGSTDNSGEILARYAQKDPRIRILTQENQGLSQARNHGMAVAQGAFLHFLDSDDWLSLHALETLYDISKEKDLDVLYFATQQEFEDGLQQDMGYYHRVESTAQDLWTGLDLFPFLIQQHCYYPGVWAQLYRTAFLQKEQLRFIPNILYEDSAFTFSCIMKAQRTYSISDIFYHYRQRSQSITATPPTGRNVESYITSWMTCLLLIKSLTVTPDQWRAIMIYMKHLRKLAHQEYHKVYATENKAFLAAFQGIEQVYFPQNADATLLQENHNMLHHREAYPELGFFGGGKECLRMLAFFREHHLSPPVVICDNDTEKQGTEIEGILILSLEEALEQYPHLHVIVTNIRVYQKLKTQAEETLGKDRVILFEI